MLCQKKGRDTSYPPIPTTQLVAYIHTKFISEIHFPGRIWGFPIRSQRRKKTIIHVIHAE